MMRDYVKGALWDFVLVALVSTSLCYMVLDGFYVDPALQYSVIPAVVGIVCLLALFAVASNKRFMLPGGVACGVVLVVAWIAGAALTPGGAIFVDSETNYLIFAMAVTLVPVMCFLLSRTRVGAAVLFIIGAFLVGFLQLFYERFELAWTIVFVAAALTLIIYRNYQQSVRTAMGVEKTSFAPGFAVALAAAVVSVGLGVGVWYGIIAPMNPEAAQIKLVTEYRALETVQVRGISDVYQTPNLDMTSDDLNDGVRTTDDIKEDVNGTPWPATGDTESDPDNNESDGSFLGMNLDNIQEAFDLQANPQNWPLLVGFLLIIALIAAYFVGRRIWRNKRLEKFRELEPDKEYEQAFLFLMGRLGRVGVSVPPGQTMREFGTSSAAALRCYDSEAGVPFKDIAEGYSNMTYGNRSVEASDVAKIESYYKGFWKACRRQLGNVKYFFKSFRL